MQTAGDVRPLCSGSMYHQMCTVHYFVHNVRAERRVTTALCSKHVLSPYLSSTGDRPTSAESPNLGAKLNLHALWGSVRETPVQFVRCRRTSLYRTANLFHRLFAHRASTYERAHDSHRPASRRLIWILSSAIRPRRKTCERRRPRSDTATPLAR